jgi:MFS-type transporter involved in bile tolerance (Atg22 family)
VAKPRGPGVAGRQFDRRGSGECAHRLPGPGHRQGQAPARHRGGYRRIPRPGPVGRAAAAHRLDGKLGARTTLACAYILAAAVTLLLFAGGALAPVLVLSLLAGAAIGAVYTLQGVYAYQLIEPGRLGMLLGIQQAVFTAGGALGPIAAGALLGATGSYTPAITIISAGFAAAASLLLLGRAPGPAEASDPTAGQDGR